MPEKANKPPKLISLTSDKPSPQDTGTVVTWTAEAKDPENDQIFYKFFLNDNPVTKWITDNKWVWTTNDTDVGENQIEVHIRDGKYGHALQNGFDDRKSSSFNITTPETKPITTTNVTRPSQTAPAPEIAPAPINEAHAESWQKTFGGSATVQPFCSADKRWRIHSCWKDRFVCAGKHDAWLIKTDSSGNKLWDRTFGGW